MAKATEVDAGYPDNADLVIDEVTGRPSLERRKGKDRSGSAIALEEAIKERLPERSLLDIVARTAYWVGWWHRFGPASGSDPKLAQPMLRYVLTTFAYGSNLGPTQAARHMRGISAHELGSTANRHFSIDKLNRAIADVVDAYLLRLDLAKVWGDASSVAADGTQVDTLIDNLLAESHIRYGGYGGIAYHHVADNYIALFSHFIPCGVWEAVYILEGLLENLSEAKPDTIHADTQGQSYPVFALAHLLGFVLLPRIRNWGELIFYRPAADARYTHIDRLFGEAGQNVIDWRLIETHWRDLMQVVVSIREGKLSSTLLLRRLRTESHKNNLYRAFRELGRVVRTITLLRFVSEPDLRAEITAATNKAEVYGDTPADLWLYDILQASGTSTNTSRTLVVVGWLTSQKRLPRGSSTNTFRSATDSRRLRRNPIPIRDESSVGCDVEVWVLSVLPDHRKPTSDGRHGVIRRLDTRAVGVRTFIQGGDPHYNRFRCRPVRGVKKTL